MSFSSLVAGAVAVFVTSNGTGAASLLAIGVVLLLIDAVGRIPEGLKYGNAEIVWAVREAARAMEEGNEERADELMDLAVEKAATDRTGRALSPSAYELAVQGALAVAIPGKEVGIEKAAVRKFSLVPDSAADLLLEIGRKKVGVVATLKIKARMLEELLRELKGPQGGGLPFDAFLVVAASASGHAAAGAISRFLAEAPLPSDVLVWTPDQGVTVIGERLEKLTGH